VRSAVVAGCGRQSSPGAVGGRRRVRSAVVAGCGRRSSPDPTANERSE